MIYGIIRRMKNAMILLAAAMAAAASVDAAPKPEISWSIMHPTAIDIAYMKRVVEKAAAYVIVSSLASLLVSLIVPLPALRGSICNWLDFQS